MDCFLDALGGPPWWLGTPAMDVEDADAKAPIKMTSSSWLLELGDDMKKNLVRAYDVVY